MYFGQFFGSVAAVLLLLLEQIQPTNVSTLSKCNSRCSIVMKCTSTVLVCGNKSAENYSTLVSVECSKLGDVFFLGTVTTPGANYLDPAMFHELLGEGMQSLILVTSVNYLSKYTFHMIPATIKLIIFLNSYHLRFVEPMSLELYNIELAIYNNSRLLTFTEMKKQRRLSPEMHCDSKHSPCLCKYFYNLKNPYIDTLPVFFNESDKIVCRRLYSVECAQMDCTIPDRAEYLKNIKSASLKKVIPDDYCSALNTLYPSVFLVSIVISLSLFLT